MEENGKVTPDEISNKKLMRWDKFKEVFACFPKLQFFLFLICSAALFVAGFLFDLGDITILIWCLGTFLFGLFMMKKNERYATKQSPSSYINKGFFK